MTELVALVPHRCLESSQADLSQGIVPPTLIEVLGEVTYMSTLTPVHPFQLSQVCFHTPSRKRRMNAAISLMCMGGS